MGRTFTIFSLLLLFWLIGCSKENTQQPKEEEKKDNKESDPIIKFIQDNKKNENIAFSLHWNDQNIVEINSNKDLPLASTAKIIVAIEYANQAAESLIDPTEEIDLEELNKYYLPYTDGGAHEAWLSQFESSTESVSLEEVAKGMIGYSSNANTDYLIERLGLDAINNRVNELNLSHHEPLYPFTSTLWIGHHLLNDGVNEEDLVKSLRSMSDEAYRNTSIEIFEEWKKSSLTDQEKMEGLEVLTMDVQRVWSDRLPKASTNDYIQIMEKLNGKDYYSEQVHSYLDPVMEQMMNNPVYQTVAEHAGFKGGSTAFVFTWAMYGTDNEGNQIEMAFFSNDLNSQELELLSEHISNFQVKLLTEEAFRDEVQEQFNR
ncbi:serine hydrolase [Oceanobacillus sp. 1P07AA]|uniref:serine hydrolase n=1 Tax=Oceanobacillus sp. 1P07AA TaxID=3132293 RepID=UPI0039A5A6FC